MMNLDDAKKHARDVSELQKKKEEEENREYIARMEEQRVYAKQTLFPSAITNIEDRIKMAIESKPRLFQVQYSTKNGYLIQLVQERLKADGFTVNRLQDQHVPEDRSYGDSGEGMHDAYWVFFLEVSGW